MLSPTCEHLKNSQKVVRSMYYFLSVLTTTTTTTTTTKTTTTTTINTFFESGDETQQLLFYVHSTHTYASYLVVFAMYVQIPKINKFLEPCRKPHYNI